MTLLEGLALLLLLLNIVAISYSVQRLGQQHAASHAALVSGLNKIRKQLRKPVHCHECVKAGQDTLASTRFAARHFEGWRQKIVPCPFCEEGRYEVSYLKSEPQNVQEVRILGYCEHTEEILGGSANRLLAPKV